MNEIIASPLFSIFLCIIAYKIGLRIQQKTKLAVANPLLIAILIVIVFLSAAGISLDQFNQGASFISMFLTPATCMLALSIYRQADKLKKNLIPILAGTLVGSIVSMTSVMLLCNVFQLDEAMAYSLIPKSVTTPIAMDVSASLGGIVPITIAAVIITGIIGAVLAPTLIKVFKIKDPVVRGIAIGPLRNYHCDTFTCIGTVSIIIDIIIYQPRLIKMHYYHHPLSGQLNNAFFIIYE